MQFLHLIYNPVRLAKQLLNHNRAIEYLAYNNAWMIYTCAKKYFWATYYVTSWHDIPLFFKTPVTDSPIPTLKNGFFESVLVDLYERCGVYNSSQSMILQSMIPWMLIVI